MKSYLRCINAVLCLCCVSVSADDNVSPPPYMKDAITFQRENMDTFTSELKSVIEAESTQAYKIRYTGKKYSESTCPVSPATFISHNSCLRQLTFVYSLQKFCN